MVHQSIKVFVNFCSVEGNLNATLTSLEPVPVAPVVAAALPLVDPSPAAPVAATLRSLEPVPVAPVVVAALEE